MTEQAKPKAATPEGERIAKVLSRAGVASRREAERMIQLGEVSVNGKVIDSPALNVTAKDRITVRGEPLAAREPARLWLYYKPEGLVTSASDEKGRDTVFDHLPEDLPRVMSVGRLDLNSEGLLLLTNDGELKRRLELPSTGWLRKYRVRIKGNPTDPELEPLRAGIVVDGERFQPMIVSLDRIQGANAWLTVGLREGKNREIRRAMTQIGLTVNRLIRVSYGPFRLGDLEPNGVEEVKGRVLRDQLGFDPDTGEEPEARRPASARPARTRAPREAGPSPAKPQRSAEAPAKAAPRSRTGGKPASSKGAFLAQSAQGYLEGVAKGGKRPSPAAKPGGGKPSAPRPTSAGRGPSGGGPRGGASGGPRGGKPGRG
ncbi:pseudouridine synthase [Gemmobacter fulvus]|uniref:pseudouridine synthase n=1 Tax=Gemmobacter fulvus TaxID=2840474 RepID=UPI002796AA63|nr:pseudouridine synthase [Gemmobacter fulvus]MDQ1849059.1 pseudouridine synthase [Gemmobacter fulvus]